MTDVVESFYIYFRYVLLFFGFIVLFIFRLCMSDCICCISVIAVFSWSCVC